MEKLCIGIIPLSSNAIIITFEKQVKCNYNVIILYEKKSWYYLFGSNEVK